MDLDSLIEATHDTLDALARHILCAPCTPANADATTRRYVALRAAQDELRAWAITRAVHAGADNAQQRANATDAPTTTHDDERDDDAQARDNAHDA